MWPGNTAVLIGGGPSAERTDWDMLHKAQQDGKCRVIACNDAYKLGFPDVVLYGDFLWMQYHPEITEYVGIVCSCSPNKPDQEWVKWVRRHLRKGLSSKPFEVAWNHNTGAAAINFALHFGVSRILLIGYDMKVGPHGQTNWYKKRKNPESAPHFSHFDGFAAVARELPKLFPDVKVINCTPDSALEHWPSVSLRKALG